MDQLFAEIGSLKETVKILEKKVTDLESENHTLKDMLHKKNSSNSSLPPSKNKNRVKPNQSLRQKTGRNTSGQMGHSGNHIKMHSTPVVVIDHNLLQMKYSCF